MLAQAFRDGHGQRTAVVFHGIAFELAAVLFNIIWWYARHDRQLLTAAIDSAGVRAIARRCQSRIGDCCHADSGPGGQTVWTIASTPDTEFAVPNQSRFAQIQPGGVLRVVDVNTGRVVSQRSVAPEWVSKGAMLLDDWLYLSGSDGLRRIPITGAEPASRVTDDRLGVLRCGMQVCAWRQGIFAIFDRANWKTVVA